MKNIDSNRLIFVVFLYTILAILFTYPLIFYLATHIIGGLEEDASHYIWNFWWINKAISYLKTNPLSTDYIFYPWGANLIFQLRGVPELLLSLLFSRMGMSLISIYNFFIILSFIFTAVGAYLLSYRLSRHTYAAILSGIIFSFSSLRAERLGGHFPLLLGYWIPFNIYFFFRMKGNKFKSFSDRLLFILTFLFAGYSDVQFAIMLTLFYLFHSIFTIYSQRRYFYKRGYILRTLSSLKYYVVSFLGVFIGFAPLFISAITLSVSGNLEPLQGWGGSASLGADFISLFLPPSYNMLFGTFTKHIHDAMSIEWESGIAYLGIFSIFSFIGIFMMKLHRQQKARFWIGCAIFFLLLSLGPRLNVAGRGLFDLDGVIFSWTPPLPFTIFHFLPFFEHFRTPARLLMMTNLSMALLVGFLVAFLSTKLKAFDHPKKVVVSISIILLFFLDGINPITLTEPSVSAFFHRLRGDHDEYAILDIPVVIRGRYMDLGQTDVRFLFDQTIHEKKVVGGYIISVPERYFKQTVGDPILGTIIALQNDPLLTPPVSVSQAHVKQFLQRYAPRYIVLRSPFTKNRPLLQFLINTFRLEEVFADQSLIAFKVVE